MSTIVPKHSHDDGDTPGRQDLNKTNNAFKTEATRLNEHNLDSALAGELTRAANLDDGVSQLYYIEKLGAVINALDKVFGTDPVNPVATIADSRFWTTVWSKNVTMPTRGLLECTAQIVYILDCNDVTRGFTGAQGNNLFRFEEPHCIQAEWLVDGVPAREFAALSDDLVMTGFNFEVGPAGPVNTLLLHGDFANLSSGRHIVELKMRRIQHDDEYDTPGERRAFVVSADLDLWATFR